MLSTLVVAVGLALSSPPLGGAEPAFVGEGYWATLAPYSGQPRFVIKLERTVTGRLQARVVTVLNTGKQPTGRCVGCPEGLDGKELVGLTIGWGFKRGSRKGEWRDGIFVDPDSRNKYISRIRIHPGGQKAKIEGYRKGSLYGWGMVLVRRGGP